MKTKQAFLFLIVTSIFSNCIKNGDDDNRIDVSQQWIIDPLGVVVSRFEGQWERKIFTTKEFELFNSLDTAHLDGTTTPDSLIATNTYTFPNPFIDEHLLNFNFNDGYSGEFVMKYIIVDSRLAPIETLEARLNANNNHASVAFRPNISNGKYRLYFTLSSQSDRHFYTSWGNIQKE